LGIEIAIPGSELEFFKISYTAQQYFPINDRWTVRLRTELGYGDAYGKSKDLPFYEHFFSGGFGSVRGFESNTLGPRSTPAANDIFSDAEGDPFGGNFLVETSVELIFPLPFIDDQSQFRAAFFADAGNVFNENCPTSSVNCFAFGIDRLRYSVGVGMTWLTGLGPMTFALSKPFNAGEFDEEESFQFELGKSL
jgi:outer membrane protein insertion porin family